MAYMLIEKAGDSLAIKTGERQVKQSMTSEQLTTLNLIFISKYNLIVSTTNTVNQLFNIKILF